jgi:oligoribonuclease NrnB/cAMP/cGMP phosphodiesterase (DHH superfamily)
MVIIYHSKDLDGYCSGAICKRKYPDAKLIGYDYGQLFPWDGIPAGEPVIMVDVSLDMMDMEKLACLSTKLTWIDHHASAINAYNEYKEHQLWSNEYITAVLQIGIAACEIAWEYLFPDEQMPEAVSMLGIYDTWRQGGKWNWETSILPFQYGMRLTTHNAEEFDDYLLEHQKPKDIDEIKSIGRTVLEYQRQQDKLAMHGAFECDFQGYKAIMCNVRGVGSLAFDSVLKPEHQLMVGFGYTGRQWSFSLRTTKEDVDVSLIAKQFGGGGHRKAAGFAVDNLSDVIDLTEFKRAQKQY